jgi:hypothetical protein
MRRLLGAAVALTALAAFLVLWGGAAAAGDASADKAGPELSGAAEFKDVELGTGITECPQAGLRDAKPKPLDSRVKDEAEKRADEGDDVRANQDYACFPQDETSIAVNPVVAKNVVASSNDYRLGWGSSGFDSTTDNANHFYDGIKMFPSVPTAHDHFDGGGDPSVAFDSEGTLYYNDLHFNRDDDDSGIYVGRSTNGGFTWSKPCTPLPLVGATDANAFCGGSGDPRQPGDGTVIYTKDNDQTLNGSVPGNDKNYMAIGPRPAGVLPQCFQPISRSPRPCADGVVGPDRIYVTWTIFDPHGTPAGADDTAHIFASFSDDRAHSWSAAKQLTGSASFCTAASTISPPNSCDSNQGATPSVNPTSGAVYVAYENFNTADENQYVMSKSLDGGNTWLGPFFITVDYDVNYPLSGGPTATRNRPDCGARGQQGGRRVLTNSCFRVNARGNLVVDQRGGAFADDLYVLISDNRNGTRESTNTDVFFFKSVDGGLTWHGPTRVNDDPSAQPVNRNCGRTGEAACPTGVNTGNDQFYPWIWVGEKGDLVLGWQDRRLDTDSTASEWPTSRTRPGNYLLSFFGGHCRVTVPDTTQCVAPSAGVITQPTAPVNPGNELLPVQTVFPFDNFGISDTVYNWDYCFRAGIFCGDYENVTIGPDNTAYALWTDARNGRSSRTQFGRNPACEQSDIFLDSWDARGRAAGQNKPEKSDSLFLVTPCPTDIQDKTK